MVTTKYPGLVMRFCTCLARTSTAYHLWCAELELRFTDTDSMPSAQRDARARNLDLLRDYRRRNEFPRNRHDPNRNAPCFIDAESRQCAVACLMCASGDKASALKVAESANFARVRQMQFLELDAWAGKSGFAKGELARIQPGYPPAPEQLNHAFDFLYAIWLVGSLAVISILVNSLRLMFAFAHRFSTSLIGIITGVMLLGLSVQVDLNRYSRTHLVEELGIVSWIAIGIACLAIALAVIPIFLRRRELETYATATPWKRAGVEFLAAMILAVTFLAGPALVYFKVIGPGAESRFNQTHEHGHHGVVVGVAISGDGSRVVTAADDGSAILWDTATAKRLHTFYRVHTDGIAMAMMGNFQKSQDNMYALATDTGANHTDGITSVAMSDDGEHIATGSMDKKAVLWSASTGNSVLSFRGHSGWIDSVALSRDGKLVLTGSSDKTAILWDAATGEKRQTFQGHTLVVTSVALSADARHVVTGSYDKTAILWDAVTGKKIQTFGDHADFVSSVAVSGDGKYVATGSWDKTAVLWDAATGQKIHTFRGHQHRVLAVALSDDAKLVVTGSTDNNAVLWDAASGQSLQSFHRHIRPITCVAMTRDGKRLVTGSGDFTAILWDTETGRKILSFGN